MGKDLKSIITIFLLTLTTLHFIINSNQDKVNHFLQIGSHHLTYFTSGNLNEQLNCHHELNALFQGLGIETIKKLNIHLVGNQISQQNYSSLIKEVLRNPLDHFSQISLRFDSISFNQKQFQNILNMLPQNLQKLSLNINLLQNNKKIEQLIVEKAQSLILLKSIQLKFANQINQTALINLLSKLKVSSQFENIEKVKKVEKVENVEKVEKVQIQNRKIKIQKKPNQKTKITQKKNNSVSINQSSVNKEIISQIPINAQQINSTSILKQQTNEKKQQFTQQVAKNVEQKPKMNETIKIQTEINSKKATKQNPKKGQKVQQVKKVPQNITQQNYKLNNKTKKVTKDKMKK